MTALDRAEHNLILRGSDSLNAETTPDKLIALFLTPQDGRPLSRPGFGWKRANGQLVDSAVLRHQAIH